MIHIKPITIGKESKLLVEYFTNVSFDPFSTRVLEYFYLDSPVIYKSQVEALKKKLGDIHTGKDEDMLITMLLDNLDKMAI